MNYLAHLYLAEEESLKVGGFIADFVKGPLTGAYPEGIELGIRLHRRIDFWSDQHSGIGQIRHLLPARFSRYSGIIADVLGDHFLSLEWQTHQPLPIDKFAWQSIELLRRHESIFPEKAKYSLNFMEKDSWLTRYHQLPYCIGILERIGQRFKRDNPLHLAAGPIMTHYEPLQHLCRDLLADIKLNVAKWREENTSLTRADSLFNSRLTTNTF